MIRKMLTFSGLFGTYNYFKDKLKPEDEVLRVYLRKCLYA